MDCNATESLISDGVNEDNNSNNNNNNNNSIRSRVMAGVSVPAGVRVCVGVFFLYITYLAQPGTSIFSWHPVLMTLAFTVLLREGVAAFSKGSVASGRPHTTKVTAHWVLATAAAVTHGLGYAAIYITKERKNKPHLTTWHGSLGLVASLFLWLQLSVGVVANYPKTVQRFVALRSLRVWHSLCGVVTLTGGVCAVCLSLWSAWFESQAVWWAVYPALVLHLLLLCAVCKRHLDRYCCTKK